MADKEAGQAVNASDPFVRVQKRLDMSLDELVVEEKKTGGGVGNKRKRGGKADQDGVKRKAGQGDAKRPAAVDMALQTGPKSEKTGKRRRKEEIKGNHAIVPFTASPHAPPAPGAPSGAPPHGPPAHGYPPPPGVMPHGALRPAYHMPPPWGYHMPPPHVYGRPPPYDPHRPHPYGAPPMHGAPPRSPMPPHGMVPYAHPHPYGAPPPARHPHSAAPPQHAYGPLPGARPHYPPAGQPQHAPPAHYPHAQAAPQHAAPQPAPHAAPAYAAPAQRAPAQHAPQQAAAPAPAATQQGHRGQMVRLRNVPPELTAQDLAEAFVSVSSNQVESVDVLRDSRGTPTGEATVIFSTLADAQNVVSRYHGGDLNGRRLQVTIEGHAGR